MHQCVCVCVCVCVLRDCILVISIDEQLSANTAAETLGILANLQVLQESVVNELSLHWNERECGGKRWGRVGGVS